MDGQFDVIRGDLSDLNITLNTVARGKHVPEVERQIRSIKECVRCVYATLPFTKIPSHTLSPRLIIHGSHIDFNKKYARLEFGAYVQAHEEHDNLMATRTTGAIALRPTGTNAQGGYYLYSLSTGRVLNRNHWTALPMPREVIDRVHVLARRSTGAPTFADRDGAIIPNDNDDDEPDDNDSDYAPDDDDHDDDDENGTNAYEDDDDDNGGEHGNNDDEIENTIDPDIDIAGIYGGGHDGDDANVDHCFHQRLMMGPDHQPEQEPKFYAQRLRIVAVE